MNTEDDREDRPELEADALDAVTGGAGRQAHRTRKQPDHAAPKGKPDANGIIWVDVEEI